MRPQADTADREVAEVAARQHGVAAIAQLRSAGLSDAAIARRVRKGWLHRVHRGVYAVGHAALSHEGRWMAAVLACGGNSPGPERIVETTGILSLWGAALSHRSAAALLGLLSPARGPVQVSVAGIGGRGRRDGIHLHRSRTLRSEMVTRNRGIPVTTAARTIADLRLAARTRGCPATIRSWELRRAIRQAEVLGLPTGAEALTERTRSDLERAFLRLCRRHRLPKPAVNARIGHYRVDFVWRQRRLILETDGYRYHRGRGAYEDDRERDLALGALGYRVVRLSERQVDEEAASVASALRRLLDEGRGDRDGRPDPLRARSGRSG